MFKKILACIDCMAGTPALVAFVANMGRRYAAQVSLLHVVTTPLGGPALTREYDPGECLRRQRAELEGLRDQEGFSGLSVATLLREGDAVAEILREAERFGPDVIVMGRHGRRGRPHAPVGATALGVLRDAGCPVLLFPTADAPVFQKLRVANPAPAAPRALAGLSRAPLRRHSHVRENP